MPIPSSPELSQLEQRIIFAKNSITTVSQERYEASLKRDERHVLEVRKKAADKMLYNCEALAEYVSYCCPNVAHDLLRQGRLVKNELDKMQKTSDPVELHNWYKARLIPLVKQSEAMAHVAATSLAKRDNKASECYQWPIHRKTRN